MLSEQDYFWRDMFRGLMLMLALAVIAVIVLRGTGLLSGQLFAPAEEQLRHDTFKQSQAYLDGVAQDLGKQRVEYTDTRSTAEHKAAIRAMALRTARSCPMEKMPADIQTWIRDLQKETNQ